jgi:hypothetical protein
MLGIGPIFLLSISLFSIFAFLFSVEENKGHRVFLATLRGKIDEIIDAITKYLASKLTYLGRHIIKLSWYYSIHKVLRFILASLVKVYDLLEGMFMSNRDRARTIKIEKKSLQNSDGHFGQVAEHKASSALSETQKKKLLQKKLERG